MEPLVTVAELETHLQRDIDPEVAALAVASASGIVRDFCRWIVAPAEEATFVLDGSGRTLQGLPTLYLTAVSEVRVDGHPINDFTWSRRGQLHRDAGWPDRLRSVEVDCTHGYPTTPDTVRAVVLVLATRPATNPEGLRSKTVGAVARSFIFETMRGDLSELQMAQIGGYRLP